MLERVPFFIRRRATERRPCSRREASPLGHGKALMWRPRTSSAHRARDESRAHRGCKHLTHRARDDGSGVAGASRRMKSAYSSVKKPVTDSNPYTLYSEKEDFTGTMDESKQECQGTWFQDKRLADKEDVLYVARRMKAFWETYPDGFTQEYCRHAADLFGEFIHIAESKVIFSAPDGLWTYSVLMRGTGILLELDHYPEVPVAGEEIQICGDVDEPGKTEEKRVNHF